MLCITGVELLRGWRQSNNMFCGGAGTAGVEGTAEVEVEVEVEAICNVP